MSGLLGHRGLLMQTAGGGGGGGVDNFDTDTLGLYTSFGTVVTPSISGGQLTMGPSAVAGQGVLARTGEVVTNGEIGCFISRSDDGGFAFRLSDNNNYYLAAIHDNSSSTTSKNMIRLYKKVSGSYVTLASKLGISFPRGTMVKFHASLAGSSIKLFLNDVEVISVTDATFSSGLAGPRSNLDTSIFDQYFWPS